MNARFKRSGSLKSGCTNLAKRRNLFIDEEDHFRVTLTNGGYLPPWVGMLLAVFCFFVYLLNNFRAKNKMADTDTNTDPDFVYFSEETGKFTVKIRKLNDSVYELHRPQGPPTMQIVFFHGFQQSLQDILKLKNREDLDMYIVVENLISDLLHAEIGQEPRCPVMLVGHSFGGLVLKQPCVNAFHQLAITAVEDLRMRQLLNFVENIKGAFFYATPHHGIENESIELLDPALLIPTGPLLDYVKSLSKVTARLNSDFAHLKEKSKWQIGGLGEGRPSKWRGKWGLMTERVIVPEGSSRCTWTFNIASGEDHISISRPASKTTRTFTALQSVLKNIADDPILFGRPGNWQYGVPEPLFGSKDVLDDVKAKLNETTKLLGFVGMGGVGKTTLAMALFNNLERDYQCTCFIRDVKGLPGLQHRRVKDAIVEGLHYGGKRCTVNDSLEGFLTGKRLLLVLDDVRHKEDLQIVNTLQRVVHISSRFIATSRDPAHLASVSHEEYGVNFLSQESSRELFASSAFPDGFSPDDERKDFADGILEKCGGLPLALQVVGNHLRGKQELFWWQDALYRLDIAHKGAGLEKNLWSVLKLSYEGLESKEEKDMFLDASTIFYKEELSMAMAAWKITMEGVHKSSWGRLLELSLVWQVYEGRKVKIGMHEQLLILGKRIASDPEENGTICRIWSDSDKALEFLSPHDEEEDDLKNIVALKCCKEELTRHRNVGQGMEPTISGRKLQKMTRLKYLRLEGIHILPANVQLPPTVVYLHFSGVNFSGFTFNPHNHYLMAVFKIIGCNGLRNLPDTFDHYLMAVFKIIGCNGFRKLPDTFEGLRELRIIEFQDSSLQSIPDLGKLTLLEILRLSWVPTARFPSLPKCLKQEVTERDFPGPFALKNENGRFVKDFQAVRVNQSLYELYRPEGETKPVVQVVFFHGLQKHHEDYEYAHLTTWRSGDGSTLWPQTWLAEDISGAHVLSVSYSTGPRQNSEGTVDRHTLLDNLLSDLLQGGVGQVPCCPVVLVGHSYGGLLIKELCCWAYTKHDRTQGSERAKLEEFLKNIRGVFYYSTPHHGSADVEIFANQIRIPLLMNFETQSLDWALLSKRFEAMCELKCMDWLSAGVGDSLPTDRVGDSLPTDLGLLEVGAPERYSVVPKHSRRYNFFLVEGADHFSICRPRSKTTRSYGNFMDFVSQILAINASRLSWRSS